MPSKRANIAMTNEYLRKGCSEIGDYICKKTGYLSQFSKNENILIKLEKHIKIKLTYIITQDENQVQGSLLPLAIA